MLTQSIRFGTRTVQLAQPWSPPASSNGELVGRDDELRLLAAAWMSRDDTLPMSPLLVGEPGVGKNRLVYEIARRSGSELYIFQGHEDVTAEDLAFAARFADGGGIDYVASPLVTAMVRGGICFIDEIGKIRPRALALLASVLDERRYIDSTMLGERVVAARGFRLVAATNSSDLDGGMLPDFLRTRMLPVIRVGAAGPDEIAEVVRGRFRTIGDHLEELLGELWNAWKEAMPKRGPSPREAIAVFALATRLADHDGEPSVSRRSVRAAVEQLFPKLVS